MSERAGDTVKPGAYCFKLLELYKHKDKEVIKWSNYRVIIELNAAVCVSRSSQVPQAITKVCCVHGGLVLCLC